MSANRVVAALTPLAAVLAGVAAGWLAEHAPGVDIPQSALEEVFIAGIGAVVAPAIVWLLGWQKHELRQAQSAGLGQSGDAEPLDGFDELDSPLAFEADEDALAFGDGPEDPLGFEEDPLGFEEDPLGFEDTDELGDEDELGGDQPVDSPLTDRVG